MSGQRFCLFLFIFELLEGARRLEMTLNTKAVRLLLTSLGIAVGCTVAAAAIPSEAEVKQLKATRQCVACDLTNAFLDGANLNEVNVTGADFRGASLYLTQMKGAELKDATFTGANLQGANLSGAKNANLAGARTDKRTTCPDGKSGPCQ
jgi:uncharacterized protein YjbI with pentapeptide repeats